MLKAKYAPIKLTITFIGLFAFPNRHLSAVRCTLTNFGSSLDPKGNLQHGLSLFHCSPIAVIGVVGLVVSHKG